MQRNYARPWTNDSLRALGRTEIKSSGRAEQVIHTGLGHVLCEAEESFRGTNFQCSSSDCGIAGIHKLRKPAIRSLCTEYRVKIVTDTGRAREDNVDGIEI